MIDHGDPSNRHLSFACTGRACPTFGRNKTEAEPEARPAFTALYHS